jgi:hypothetical protein
MCSEWISCPRFRWRRAAVPLAGPFSGTKGRLERPVGRRQRSTPSARRVHLAFATRPPVTTARPQRGLGLAQHRDHSRCPGLESAALLAHDRNRSCGVNGQRKLPGTTS